MAGEFAVSPGTLCQTPGSDRGPGDRDRLHPRGEQHRGDALLPGDPPGAARPPGRPDMEARGHGGRQKKRLQVENRPEIYVLCSEQRREKMSSFSARFLLYLDSRRYLDYGGVNLQYLQ